MNSKLMMVGFALVFNITMSFAQKSQGYVLTGQFKGLPDGTKVYLRTQEKDTVGKTISKGDQFIFKGDLPLNGRFHFIAFDTLVSKIGSKSIFLENKEIQVTGEMSKREIVINGSAGDADEKEIGLLMSPIRARGQGLSDQIMQVSGKFRKLMDSTEKAGLKKQFEDLTAQQKLVMTEFKETGLKWIMAHNNSLYTPYLISVYKSILNSDEMQTAYDHLTPEVKGGYYASKLKDDIESKRSSAKIAEGKVVPDFVLITSDGTKMSILDIASKNKYTLIDCWASWCAPCRAEVPALKEIYAAFKDKGFGIVGISSDKDINKWKKAVVEDATPWVHMVESDKKEITNTYNLRAIPAYMLIDNKGRLVAFDCLMSSIKSFGPSLRGEGLKKTLEGLLGEGKVDKI